MENKDINGTAKANFLNAKRRLWRKNGVKETDKVLPTTTPATRRGGPRPVSSGREVMDVVPPRPGPGRERAPGPWREPAPRPHGARHEHSRVDLSHGGRTGPCGFRVCFRVCFRGCNC